MRRETQVDRSDLCDCWFPRDPSSVISSNTSVETTEPGRNNRSDLFIFGTLGVSFVALVTFVFVRYGEAIAEPLEGPFDYIFAGFMVLVGCAIVALLGSGLLWLLFLLAVFIWEILTSNDIFDNQSLKESLHSGKTLYMSKLLEAADGNISTASRNRELFAGSEAWESLVLLALIYEKVATLLVEAMSESDAQETAANALSRAANLIDGVPDHEENVLLWRSAPENLDFCDWVTVARAVVTNWSETAQKFLDTADIVRNTQKVPPSSDAHESHNTTFEPSAVKSLEGKVRRCINCNARFPDGGLQCSVCGSSRFIWE